MKRKMMIFTIMVFMCTLATPAFAGKGVGGESGHGTSSMRQQQNQSQYKHQHQHKQQNQYKHQYKKNQSTDSTPNQTRNQRRTRDPLTHTIEPPATTE